MNPMSDPAVQALTPPPLAPPEAETAGGVIRRLTSIAPTESATASAQTWRLPAKYSSALYA